MPESYMARKPAVVIVTCSDQRRNDALKAFTDELEKQGYTTYTVRQPGGALQYARAFWFVVALQLRVFLKKGALYLYLENHPDCAGLAYLRDSVRERHSLRQRGIEDETSHHMYVLQRAAKRMYRAAWFDGYDIKVAFQLADGPDAPIIIDGNGPFPKGSTQLDRQSLSLRNRLMRRRLESASAD